MGVKFSHPGGSWSLINVYAPNQRNARNSLWHDLTNWTNISKRSQWLMVGDFNSPLYPLKKCGGIVGYSDTMADLANFLSNTSLVEIDLLGQSFTWTNRHLGDGLI